MKNPVLDQWFAVKAPARPSSLQPQRLRRAAAHAVAALKVLANEDRLLLLCQISHGEMCVGELEERLDIAQPTLSQQLRVLRNEGAVATRREGKNVYYRLADPRLLSIIAALYGTYCAKPPAAAPARRALAAV